MKADQLVLGVAIHEQIKRLELANKLMRNIGTEDKDAITLKVELSERSNRYHQGETRVDIELKPGIIQGFITGEIARLKQLLRDMGVEIDG